MARSFSCSQISFFLFPYPSLKSPFNNERITVSERSDLWRSMTKISSPEPSMSSGSGIRMWSIIIVASRQRAEEEEVSPRRREGAESRATPRIRGIPDTCSQSLLALSPRDLSVSHSSLGTTPFHPKDRHDRSIAHACISCSRIKYREPLVICLAGR